MGEVIPFMIANWGTIVARTVEHIALVGVAVGLAIITGVPLGIVITQSERAANVVLYFAAIMITIPSIALFGLTNDVSARVTEELV